MRPTGYIASIMPGFLAMLPLVLVGCDRGGASRVAGKDEQLRSQLVGLWRMDDPDPTSAPAGERPREAPTRVSLVSDGSWLMSNVEGFVVARGAWTVVNRQVLVEKVQIIELSQTTVDGRTAIRVNERDRSAPAAVAIPDLLLDVVVVSPDKIRLESGGTPRAMLHRITAVK